MGGWNTVTFGHSLIQLSIRLCLVRMNRHYRNDSQQHGIRKHHLNSLEASRPV